jgi:eukaryotic-like serine/threonine-protein kinase
MDFDPHALVGALVADRYRLEAVVGEGGFSVVYRATHLAWRRTMAVKVLREVPGLDERRRHELLAAFHREAELLAELSERTTAIVQARDVGTLPLPSGGEAPYIVLEWLEGQTLEEALVHERQAGTEPRSLEETLELLAPVGEALALAHERGIVHRDVKPSNVFVLSEGSTSPRLRGVVKLLDFGIAKVVEGPESGARVTAVQAFTPRYGAPEQFDKRLGRTSAATDVFAFASLLVEVLIGRPIVSSDRLFDLAQVALDEEKRPTPATFGILVSDHVDAAFAKALAVRPADRFADMRAFVQALEEAMRAAPGSGLLIGDARMMPESRVASSRPRASSAGAASVHLHDTTLDEALPSALPARVLLRVSEVPGASLDLRDTAPPVPTPKGAWKRRGTAPLMGAVGVLALAVVGARTFVGRTPVSGAASSSSAMAPATALPSAPPPPACPAGMALVNGGDFFMGSDDPKATADERPAHPVHLSEYCLDVHEVTAAAFKACSDSGKCKRSTPKNEWEGITARQRKLYDPLCNVGDVAGHGNHPMNCVDWESAEAFCQERGGRLPTEAEWELAARGSDGRVYPWGDEAPSPGLVNACGLECVAWGRKNPDPDGPLSAMYKSDDGFRHTAPVGSFPRGKTMHGMDDMVGNVWEWVADYNGPYKKGARVTDPKGPEKGEERGIRGGAWNGGEASWLRPTFRFSATPTMRSHGIGFRCAK